MLIPVVLFIIGLLCLIKGGDWFVDGASALARRFHLPELLIGATVVSIGTTLPEVMVSTMSAVSGHGEIAYGNAIGSVICNAALIAAITIAVRPGKVDRKTLGMPVAFFFAAAAIYCVAAYGFGKFTRPMGLIMLALFVAYMVANVLQMKNAPAGNVERVLICMPFLLPCCTHTPRPFMLSPASRLCRASHTRQTASVPARSRECTIWREREAR